MDSEQTFIRGTHAPDGIHEDVETNALRNEMRWHNRMKLEWFMNQLAPYIIVAIIVVAFLAIGYIELGGF